MVVTVQYTTQLKAALGIDQELIELDDDATFASLLKQLEKQHGSSFADLVLLADGRLLPSIIVCIDDRQLSADQDIPLRDGNQVMLLSAISGG